MKKEQQTQSKETTKRQFEGVVVSTAEDKTVRVRVERTVMHPKYKKQYRVFRKYPVHDEKGVAKSGDIVVFEECRPLSKTKRWRLINVVKTAA